MDDTYHCVFIADTFMEVAHKTENGRRKARSREQVPQGLGAFAAAADGR